MLKASLWSNAEMSVMRSLAQNFNKVPLPKVEFDQHRFLLSMEPCTLARRDQIRKHLGRGVIVCGNQVLLGEIAENKQVKPRQDLTKDLTDHLPMYTLMKEYPDTSGGGTKSNDHVSVTLVYFNS